MSSTRQLNMQKRRDRILSEARKVISEKGFEAFNLRDLADLSELTVPTVYNLIGNKDQILKALIAGAYAELDEKFSEHPVVPIGELPTTISKIMIELLSGQEDYYRATAMASERMEGREEVFGKTGVMRTSLSNITGYLCERATAEGLLKGDIRQQMLVEQMVPALQLAFRDWAYRLISLAEMRTILLTALYVGLAADAVDVYRADIATALSEL
jgi:AcrR family transcriptional regulator